MKFKHKVMAALSGTRESAIRKAAAAMDPNTKFDRSFSDKQAAKVGLFAHKKFELQFKMDSGSSFVYEVISDISKRGKAGITCVQAVITKSSKPGYSDITIYDGKKAMGKTDNMAAAARAIDAVLAEEYSAYEPVFNENANKGQKKSAASAATAPLRKATAIAYGTYRDAVEMDEKVREIYEVLKNGGRRRDSNDFGHEVKTCVEYMDRELEKYWSEHGKDPDNDLEDTLMEMWEFGPECGRTADAIYADLKNAYKVCLDNDDEIFAGDSDEQGSAFIEWACSTQCAALQALREYYLDNDEGSLESAIEWYQDETGKKIRKSDAKEAVSYFGAYNFKDEDDEFGADEDAVVDFLNQVKGKAGVKFTFSFDDAEENDVEGGTVRTFIYDCEVSGTSCTIGVEAHNGKVISAYIAIDGKYVDEGTDVADIMKNPAAWLGKVSGSVTASAKRLPRRTHASAAQGRRMARRVKAGSSVKKELSRVESHVKGLNDNKFTFQVDGEEGTLLVDGREAVGIYEGEFEPLYLSAYGDYLPEEWVSSYEGLAADADGMIEAIDELHEMVRGSEKATASARRVKADADAWRYKMVLLDGIKIPVYFNGDTAELYKVFDLLSAKDKKDIAASFRREGGEIVVHETEDDPSEREVSVAIPNAQDPAYSYDWKVNLGDVKATASAVRRVKASVSRDVECTIRWKDDGSTEAVTIHVGSDDASIDDDIFFYCGTEAKFENLKKEDNGEDFVVIDD